MTAVDFQAIENRHKRVFRKAQRGREVAVGAVVLVLLYVVVSLMQFDLGGVARRWDATSKLLSMVGAGGRWCSNTRQSFSPPSTWHCFPPYLVSPLR